MPELPEVESLRIGLERVLIGEKISKVIVKKPKIVSQKKSEFSVFDWENCQIKSQEIFEKKLVGQEFVKIERRAKNLILTMKSGDILLVHLKMTGQLVFVPKIEKLNLTNLPQNINLGIQTDDLQKTKINNLENTQNINKKNLQNQNLEIKKDWEIRINSKKPNSKVTATKVFLENLQINNLESSEFDSKNQTNKVVSGGHPIEVMELPNKHTHIILELTGGTLFYNDIRQFGYVRYFMSGNFDQKHFDKLGVEPLSTDFTLLEFSQNLKKLKTGILKKILLDQKIVVGLGNIYCDEVCFAASVLPMRNVNSLTDSEIKKIFLETRRILTLAIQSGGSSIANYLLVDGKRGNYADFHLVYGKFSKPCSVCGNILQKTKISGRTTTFCNVCQK